MLFTLNPVIINYNRANLHDDVVDVVVVDDLKVLDAGLRHAPVEVQHVALGVVAPHRGLECMIWKSWDRI